MTQKNIDIMDMIVDRIAEGKKLSDALKTVYTKRTVEIPNFSKMMNKDVRELKMSMRTTNAFMRSKLTTIGKIAEFCKTNKITEAKAVGASSGVELLETILDWCWDHMDMKEKTAFLIDTVERNSSHIREELM
jgi:hypothetical protein